MSTKSHVSIERALCPVCGTPHETGNLLVDTRLKGSLDKYTDTHWKMCEEHQKLSDDGYIALVEVDPGKSDFMPGGNIKPDGAYRTGPIIHIRREAAATIFNINVASDIFFVDPEVTKKLRDEARYDQV